MVGQSLLLRASEQRCELMASARLKFRYGHLVAWAGLIAMIAAFYYGARTGHLWTDFPELVGNPWGIVTLIDIYVGFALFSCWVVWRERSGITAAGWVFLIMLLGNIAASLYVIVALNACQSDARRFWFGSRSEASSELQ